ncbi:MAG: hypothetical protein IT431_03125 [Phycisphaerales bacterium]|nr:hypothetical protein [Phycisphaerales bacterium]
MPALSLIRALAVAGLTCAVATQTASAQFGGKPKPRDPKPATQEDLKQFRDEADEVLAPITSGTPGQAQSQAAAHWSIVLVAFTGDQQTENAAMGVMKARTEGGLPGAYAEKRVTATVVAYGRYDRPDDPQAKADLEMIRTLRLGGQTPFATALLAPPEPSHLAGSLPELDLRNAKKLLGKERALYTLQVAIYGRIDRSPASADEIAEYRRAAEAAAVILRRDGELAFYYHAAERSMVTVGAFGEADYEPLHRPGIESLDLMRARELHPLNLLNGQGLRERIPGAKGDGPEVYRMQPSMLVGVPES